ncbi:ribbon-helix-helix domain-containing protein [Methylomagnum sp.]
MPRKPKPSASQNAALGEPRPSAATAHGVPAPEPAATHLPPSRQGKKALTGFFDPAISREIKQLALNEDKTVQSLLAEAINDLFVKYGRTPTAS